MLSSNWAGNRKSLAALKFDLILGKKLWFITPDYLISSSLHIAIVRQFGKHSTKLFVHHDGKSPVFYWMTVAHVIGCDCYNLQHPHLYDKHEVQ